MIDILRERGFAVVDMTDNEVAKLHVRHMVGGHHPDQPQELLYRFEFPERPGALLEFLSGLGTRWNITLFHYRNHGAAFGRVLVGFEAAPSEHKELAKFLGAIGYRFRAESDNEAYQMFLK